MREIVNQRLWTGNMRDARNLPGLLARGVAAVVDLAVEELPASLSRELCYCRFPLQDGAGNAPHALQLAIRTVASLIEAECPVLVTCSMGHSRSPAIAAAALALVRQIELDAALSDVWATYPCDVSPGLWCDVHEVFDSCRHPVAPTVA